MDKVNTILPWKIRINHYSPIFSKILHLWFLLKYLKLDSRSWSDLYCFWHICIIWLVHWYTFKKLQSRTKMSRRMAVAMSSFKKKLFRILAKENNTQSWTLAGSFLPLTEQHWSSDMVGWGEGFMTVTNLQNGSPVGG